MRLAARIAFVGSLVALFTSLGISPVFAGARESQRYTVSPLPASDYSVRPVCPSPTRGHASCLALELVPKTAAARAHSHPLAMSRRVPVRAGRTAQLCNPPTAAEGCYGLRPQDLHSAYQLPTSAPSAQTIALVDAYNDPTAEADLAVYDTEFHLPSCTTLNGCFEKVNEHGQTSPLPASEPGWAREISLDIEVAHATCQSCHILLAEADNESYVSLEAAEEAAVTLGATEVSNSWGGEELSTDEAAFDHPGVAITAAAGDDGYLNWDSPHPEERGFAQYPASSPHVVAVGGTRLGLTVEGAWSTETIWNDGTTSGEGYGAGGGGCSAGFAAPNWQQKLTNWSSVGCGSTRALTDVSAVADPYTGVAVYDSTPTEEESGWYAIGGTSAASPLIASAFALAGGAGGVAYPGRTLYENEISVPASLHDIQLGSNGECTKPFKLFTGLSGCTALEEADNSCATTRAICLAGSGYDGPSGVGTPDGIRAFVPIGAAMDLPQQIAFTSSAPGSATVGGASYAVSASASSGLAVSLSSGTPSVCALAGSTVSFIGAGRCTIDANQVGDAEYEQAPEVQQSFAVSKRLQQIAFTSSPPGSATVGGASFAASASASSGLAVALSSGTPAVCTIVGSTVSFIGAGRCRIDANQAGDGEYEQAPEVQQSFAVTKRLQQIVFTSSVPGSATVGGASYAVSASASSGLAVALSSGTPAVCTIVGSTVSFIRAGQCTIVANQAGNAGYDAADEVQQSFAVAAGQVLVPAPPLTPPITLTPASPLTPVLTVTPTPNSDYSLLGSPTVNPETGAVTFKASVSDPGRFSWMITFPNGRFGAFAARSRRCGSGQIARRRTCLPARIVFSHASATFASAGIVSFTVIPGAAAQKALRKALVKRRSLPITATLTFQSSLGGPPVSHGRAIRVRLQLRTKKAGT